MSKKSLIISISLFVGIVLLVSACKKEPNQTVANICSANRTTAGCPQKAVLNTCKTTCDNDCKTVSAIKETCCKKCTCPSECPKTCCTAKRACSTNCAKSCCATKAACPANCAKACCAVKNTDASTTSEL